MMYELENILELQQELNIWEMEEAFAEANSQYLSDCENVTTTQSEIDDEALYFLKNDV